MEVVLGFDVGGLVCLVRFGVYNIILNTPFSPSPRCRSSLCAVCSVLIALLPETPTYGPVPCSKGASGAAQERSLAHSALLYHQVRLSGAPERHLSTDWRIPGLRGLGWPPA